MTKSRAIVWYSAAALTVFGLVGGLLCYHYFAGGTITTLDGRTVTDLSVSEVGELAGSKFYRVRQIYLTHLERYKELAATPLPKDLEALEAQVRAIVKGRILNEAESRRAVSALPVGATEDLSKRVALVLRRMSGESANAYLESVRGEKLSFDNRADSMAEFYLGYNLLGPNESTVAGNDLDFRKIYSIVSTQDSGKHMITSWAGASEGTRCVAESVETSTQYSSLLFSSYTKELESFFQGGLSTAAPVCHEPQEDWNQIRARYDRLVRFEMVTIVANRRRIPGLLTVYYLLQRWWLQSVTQSASPRVAAGPSFVF